MVDHSDADLEADQPNTAGDSLIAVLDELISTVSQARGVPMSASAMINRAEVLDLLETARDIVPDQIHAADTIIGEAGEVKADAQRRARIIIQRANDDAEDAIRQARARAEVMVSEHQITESAQRKAEAMLEEARGQARKLADGANRYADSTLATLHKHLETAMNQADAGRRELARRAEHTDAAEPQRDEQRGRQGDRPGPPPAQPSQPTSQREDQSAIFDYRASKDAAPTEAPDQVESHDGEEAEGYDSLVLPGRDEIRPLGEDDVFEPPFEGSPDTRSY